MLLLLAAALIAGSVWASPQAIRFAARGNTPNVVSAALKAPAKAPARVAGVDAVTATPEGVLHDNMSLSANALYPRGFEIYQRFADGKVSAIVEGTDGCLYVKDPVSVFPQGSWLKLTPAGGNSYVAKLPQSASAEIEYEGGTYRINYDRLDFDEDEGYYYPSFGQSELTFEYKDGVLRATGDLAGDEDMAVMLGLTFDNVGPDEKDDAWVWYGVNCITVAPVTDTPAALPAGLTPARKILVSEGAADVAVSYAADGTDAYLNLPGFSSFIRGSIAGGKATFPSGQYLGVSGGAHCYFAGSKIELIVDEEEGEYYEKITRLDNLTFDYLPSDGIILSTTDAILVNEGTGSVYGQSVYKAPLVKDYSPNAGKPQTPSFVRYDEYDDFDEYGVIVVDLPAQTVSGAEISGVDLHYNIILKEGRTAYTFASDLYEMLADDLTDVPFGYDNDYDFEADGSRHTIVIYEPLGTVVGVQTVNTAAGETHRSDIAWSDGTFSAGIADIEAPAGVGEGAMFDLSGRPAEGSAPGFYIQAVRTTDGNIVMKKVIKK